MDLHSFRFGAEFEGWIDVGVQARARDDGFIAPLRASVRRQLAEGHPMWRQVDHRLFVAGGRARCAAFVNPRLCEGNAPLGQIGWFEACDDDAALAVLDSACAWLRLRGCRRALGPMNGSTWHSYRFVTGGQATPPFFLEPSNPASYPAIWRRHGWRPLPLGYLSTEQDNAAVVAAVAARPRAEGYRIEPMDVRDLRRRLQEVHEICLQVFAGNAFFSSITWEEFAALYDGIERVIDPALLLWLRDPRDAVAGFVFGLPDLAEAGRRMRGRAGLLGKLAWVTAPPPRRLVVKSMGILSEHQGKGLATTLLAAEAAAGLARNLPMGIRALMAEDNRSFAMATNLQRILREYTLFDRPLG